MWRETAPRRRACGTDLLGRRWCHERQQWLDERIPDGDRCPGCGRRTWAVSPRHRSETVAAL
jgi:hypothetical protein